MPQWSKNLTLIAVLVAYSATVWATLARGELPDATLIGIPIVAITALAPPISIGRRRPGAAQTDESPNEGDTP
jgi:hypothetical protein